MAVCKKCLSCSDEVRMYYHDELDVSYPILFHEESQRQTRPRGCWSQGMQAT